METAQVGLREEGATHELESRWDAIAMDMLGQSMDLWMLPVKSGVTPHAYLQTPADETDAHFSPDGKWVLYASNE
ncbi:MAG TPA: hypothetical protein VE910_05700, partial [Dongiaceae bacterium]|nr:hypothetical protein [Dongiaceae bacterium]